MYSFNIPLLRGNFLPISISDIRPDIPLPLRRTRDATSDQATKASGNSNVMAAYEPRSKQGSHASSAL